MPLRRLFLSSGSGRAILWLLKPQAFSSFALPPHVPFTCWHCLYRPQPHQPCHRACPGHQPVPLRLLWEPPRGASCFSSPSISAHTSIPPPSLAQKCDGCWLKRSFLKMLISLLFLAAQKPAASCMRSAGPAWMWAPVSGPTCCLSAPCSAPPASLSPGETSPLATSLQVCGCLAAQSCLTLCHLMDCSPPGSFVHGIFQATVLEWVAISFPSRSS